MVIPGFDCGGSILGDPVDYGDLSLIDLSMCEDVCNKYAECKGFVRDSNKVCKLWTGRPPPVHPYTHLYGRTCHKKTSGNFFFHNVEWFFKGTEIK